MDRNMLAYCGLYCGACMFRTPFLDGDARHFAAMPEKYAYVKGEPLAPENACPGCRAEGSQCEGCAIRDCAREKSLPHCGACGEFPCGKLMAFCGDGVPHHGETIDNLRRLRQTGEDAWLREQENKYGCACGRRLSWYMPVCPDCAAERDETRCER